MASTGCILHACMYMYNNNNFSKVVNLFGSIWSTGGIGAGRRRCGNDVNTILMHETLKKYVNNSIYYYVPRFATAITVS